MRNIDWTKAYIVGMSVLILGLAVAILINYMKVGTYERSFREAKTTLYKKLVDEVETARAFQKREEEGARVDLDNPISYIDAQKTKAKVDQKIDFAPDKNKSTRGGYEDTTYKITINGLIDRERLGEFMFQLENGSSLLKVSRIDLDHARSRRNEAAPEDRWTAAIEVGFRKALTR